MAPPNISPRGLLLKKNALKYKVKQRKKQQISFQPEASLIDFETQIPLRI